MRSRSLRGPAADQRGRRPCRLTASQIRAALGKFTLWLEANFESTVWPFGWAYGSEVDPDNPHEYHYEMSVEQAKAWRAARTTGERA